MIGLGLVWNLFKSRPGTLGEDLVAQPGKGKILFGDTSLIMRGE